VTRFWTDEDGREERQQNEMRSWFYYLVGTCRQRGGTADMLVMIVDCWLLMLIVGCWLLAVGGLLFQRWT
jgi:hypothetical protein